MPFLEPDKPEYLKAGKLTRLFPTDKSAERRATSVFLSTLMSVEAYRNKLLRDIGAKCNSRSKIECYTEVGFDEGFVVNKSSGKKATLPDGLIIITTGKKQWKALVETKIGDEVLSQKQIEDYLQIARKQGIDAIITISNQYVSHHSLQPDSIGKIDGRTKGSKLIHWSWGSLLAQALIWMKDHKKQEFNVADDEQRYILHEFVRFCADENSGVNYKYKTMGESWSTFCKSAQQGDTRIPKDILYDAVSSWRSLIRSTSLQMGMDLGENVEVHSMRVKSNNEKSNEQVTSFQESFIIPRTASNLKIVVDVAAKTVSFSMSVKANLDYKRADSVVKSFRKMITSSDEHLLITAILPGNYNNIKATLNEINKFDGHTISDKCPKSNKGQVLPKKFTIRKTINIAPITLNNKSKKFPVFLFNGINNFYDDVGKHLKNWDDRPPEGRSHK